MSTLRDPVRGLLESVGLDPAIRCEFQYNPAELSDKRSVAYAALNAPGMLMPLRQYSAGGDRTLSFTVLVDGLFAADRPGGVSIATDERGGIAPELAKYRAFSYPRTERWQEAGTATHGFAGLYVGQETVFAAPPQCRFAFGERVIDCVVTEVNVTEKVFNRQLDPVRAEVAITLVEISPYSVDPTGGGF